MKYNYAITGHKGLIGTELVKRLGTPNLAIDLRESKSTDTLWWINTKVDIFFHLAAFCKINEIIKSPELAFENVKGIYSILEFCRRNNIPKVIYFSSSRVLSKEKNPYVASKLYGEELIKGYHECYGIDYLIIRPSTVYAPGKDKSNRLMNIWINNAKENKPLIIYGDKNKSLSFTYIDDFNDSLMFLMNNEWNKEYTIAGKNELLVDVAKEIIKQTNSKSKIIFKKPEIAQPQNVFAENDGLTPKIDIKEGVRRCLE